VQRLAQLAPDYQAVVPEHQVRVLFSCRGETHPRHAFILINIWGSRIDGQWNFSFGEFCRMLNTACPEFTIRLA